MSGIGPPVLSADDPDAIPAAIDVLWMGGIVGVPTETVYGLAVLPQPEPLATLLIAKRRPSDKGITLAVDSLDQVEAVAEVSAAARHLADRFWPGPLTLVLPPRTGSVLPDPLLGPTGAVGFRLPDHPVPRGLAAALGPIGLTSANLSGEPDARTSDELIAAIGDSIGLVIDGGAAQGGVPSTVVAFDGNGANILREGAIGSAAIRAALR